LKTFEVLQLPELSEGRVRKSELAEAHFSLPDNRKKKEPPHANDNTRRRENNLKVRRRNST
jgi:hypothetical protein